MFRGLDKDLESISKVGRGVTAETEHKRDNKKGSKSRGFINRKWSYLTITRQTIMPKRQIAW